MEKLFIFLVRIYLRLLSYISTSLAAKQAIYLFQKPKKRAFKEHELEFYAQAKHFKVAYSEEDLDAYEIGSENKKLILLVHGWGSNLGRLSEIAFKLKDKGYRVVGLNFPAHGYSKLNQTNMIFCKEALKNLINNLNIREPFSVVTHSFGSGVSAFALADLGIKVNKIVFLTSANKIADIFLDFKKILHLEEKSYQMSVKYMEELAQAKLSDLNVQDILKQVNFDKILIIHDKYDTMLPYRYATELAENVRDAELMTIENKGHSGMLFEPEVIQKVLEFID